MGLLFRDFFNQIDQDYIRAKFENLKDRFYAYGKRPSVFVAADDGKNMEVDMFADKFIELPFGCEIYWEGKKYPMKQYILRDHIITLTQFKRGVPMFLRFIKGDKEFADQKFGIFKKIAVIIGATIWWKYLIEYMHWGLKDTYLQPATKYNQPARELYQAIDNEKVRDILCSVTEYDSAYKYRVQDIAAEARPIEFIPDGYARFFGYLIGRHSRPVREIDRLIKIIIEREDIGDVKSGSDGFKGGLAKILIFKNLLLWYLEFSPKLLKEICKTIQRIDFDAIKPTLADKFWMCSPAYTYSYDFMGLNSEERKKLRIELEKL